MVAQEYEATADGVDDNAGNDEFAAPAETFPAEFATDGDAETLAAPAPAAQDISVAATCATDALAAAFVPGAADPVDAQIEKMVYEVVIALVDTPEAVQVSSGDDGQSLVVEVRVADGEAGKVIGRQGRIIKSLRTLARAASSYMNGRHVEVEIID
jgi:predicted RNA-binding protein YlqC (UPF0109 family)